MKNILLINTFSPLDFKIINRFVPLGLLYIGSSLLKANYEVYIKDIKNDVFGMNEDEIEDYLNNDFISYLLDEKPDFIGIGVQFSIRFPSALRIAKIIKKVLGDNCPIVFGGPHFSLFFNPIMEEFSFINYIIVGEGEESIVQLLDAHFNNKKLLSEVDGLVYRNNGKIQFNKKTKYIHDMDSISFPSYELINIEDYYFDTSSWWNPKKVDFKYNFPIMTSRGCPNKCIFCMVHLRHGVKYRMRSAKNVVDEIQYLYDNYNCRYISFIDDNISVSKIRIIKIMNEIQRRNLNIQFDNTSGLAINTMDEEILESMVSAGLVRTAVAIESGSEYIRNIIFKKKLTDTQIYKFFEMVKKYNDLRFVAFFICGIPQETEETLAASFQMIKNLPLDNVGLSIIIPFFGTEIYYFAEKHGLLLVDVENLHKMGNISYQKKFYIKPFDLDIEYIRRWREIVFAYINYRFKKSMRKL